jgi:large subunit ribosomal protein L32e
MLLMHNKTYTAEIASAVSAPKRVQIVERARVLGIKVTNAGAKLRVEEA